MNNRLSEEEKEEITKRVLDRRVSRTKPRFRIYFHTNLQEIHFYRIGNGLSMWFEGWLKWVHNG